VVKIRLARTGAKKRPCYRIVAIDHHKAPHGRPLEFLGTYDPKTEPPLIRIAMEKVDAWRARGAQLTPAVRSIVRRARRQSAGAS
jgi:small subunit ribosomal protein S16